MSKNGLPYQYENSIRFSTRMKKKDICAYEARVLMEIYELGRENKNFLRIAIHSRSKKWHPHFIFNMFSILNKRTQRNVRFQDVGRKKMHRY